MLGALGRELPAAGWSVPEGGYFLWLELPGDVATAELAQRASAAGVSFVAGTEFFGGHGGESALHRRGILPVRVWYVGALA